MGVIPPWQESDHPTHPFLTCSSTNIQKNELPTTIGIHPIYSISLRGQDQINISGNSDKPTHRHVPAPHADPTIPFRSVRPNYGATISRSTHPLRRHRPRWCGTDSVPSPPPARRSRPPRRPSARRPRGPCIPDSWRRPSSPPRGRTSSSRPPIGAFGARSLPLLPLFGLVFVSGVRTALRRDAVAVAFAPPAVLFVFASFFSSRVIRETRLLRRAIPLYTAGARRKVKEPRPEPQINRKPTHLESQRVITTKARRPRVCSLAFELSTYVVPSLRF